MKNWEDRNLYDMLGVSSNASKDVIKKSYRKLASQWHPDRNPDNPHAVAKLQLLNYAKEILLDDNKRVNYDLGLKTKIKSVQKPKSKSKQDIRPTITRFSNGSEQNTSSLTQSRNSYSHLSQAKTSPYIKSTSSCKRKAVNQYKSIKKIEEANYNPSFAKV